MKKKLRIQKDTKEASFNMINHRSLYILYFKKIYSSIKHALVSLFMYSLGC